MEDERWCISGKSLRIMCTGTCFTSVNPLAALPCETLRRTSCHGPRFHTYSPSAFSHALSSLCHFNSFLGTAQTSLIPIFLSRAVYYHSLVIIQVSSTLSSSLCILAYRASIFFATVCYTDAPSAFNLTYVRHHDRATCDELRQSLSQTTTFTPTTSHVDVSFAARKTDTSACDQEETWKHKESFQHTQTHPRSLRR